MIKSGRIDLLLATTNEGKIREIKQSLRDLPLRLHLLQEFSGLEIVKEVGTTYEENATLKSLEYSRQTGFHALADDSGLVVDLLGGLPGSHSARYGGPGLSDQQRTQKLLDALEKFQNRKRSAHFISILVLVEPTQQMDEPERVLQVTRGVCEGSIARSSRGLNGFGYDSVFIPQGYKKTFGELSANVKNRISHRARALSEMKCFMENWMRELDR